MKVLMGASGTIHEITYRAGGVEPRCGVKLKYEGRIVIEMSVEELGGRDYSSRRCGKCLKQASGEFKGGNR